VTNQPITARVIKTKQRSRGWEGKGTPDRKMQIMFTLLTAPGTVGNKKATWTLLILPGMIYNASFFFYSTREKRAKLWGSHSLTKYPLGWFF